MGCQRIGKRYEWVKLERRAAPASACGCRCLFQSFRQTLFVAAGRQIKRGRGSERHGEPWRSGASQFSVEARGSLVRRIRRFVRYLRRDTIAESPCPGPARRDQPSIVRLDHPDHSDSYHDSAYPTAPTISSQKRERNRPNRRIFQGKGRERFRKKGVRYVLQPMWSSNRSATELPELWSTDGRHRSDTASRARPDADCLPSDGAACVFTHRPAYTDAFNPMDCVRHLFRPHLAAGSAISSHGIRTWRLDAGLGHLGDRALSCRWLAPALYRHRSDRSRHSFAGRWTCPADPPTLGANLRHRCRCADAAEAVSGHDPGDLYLVGSAGKLGDQNYAQISAQHNAFPQPPRPPF